MGFRLLNPQVTWVQDSGEPVDSGRLQEHRVREDWKLEA